MTTYGKGLNYSEDYNEDEIELAKNAKRWSYSEDSSETAAKLREEKKRGLLMKMDSLKKSKSDSRRRMVNNTAGMLFGDRKKSSGEDSLNLEDVTGIGPLTFEDMRKAMYNVQEEKIVCHDNKKKVYVYVESAATGRFLKYAMSIDGGTIDDNDHDSSADYHCCLLCPKRETREHAISNLELFMKTVSIFLNGLLAGYSVDILYQVVLNNQPKDFAIHYASRANEARRFYFIADTICFSMSLFQYEFKKGGSATSFMLPNFADARFLLTMLCYLVCLVLSLVASFIEDDLFQFEKQGYIEDKIDGENWYTAAKYLVEKELDTRVHRLQVLSIFRSVLCVISWIIICRTAFDEYSKLQRANNMMKRIEDLSES